MIESPYKKQRWKVAINIHLVEFKTVTAGTPEEAVEAVKKGLGRPAGRQARVVSFEAMPMGEEKPVHTEKRPLLFNAQGVPV